MTIENITFPSDTITITNGNGSTTLSGTLTVDYTGGTVTGSLTDGQGRTYSNFTYTANNGGNYVLTSGTTTTSGGAASTYGLAVSYPNTGANAQAPATVTTTSTLIGLGTAQTTNVPVNSSAACFVSGTLIRTERGDVMVEALAVGDLVVTASGTHRPIRWIGHRVTDCRRHPHPDEAQPVRVLAHAFGHQRPMRDLRVSPGHALCVDLLGEVLIPAATLVNGSTIVQEDVDRVTYWHVELDSHDILLAENMPAESYLDMGNRPFFAEAGLIALDGGPDVRVEGSDRTHADFCRPFHVDGPVVEAVRAQLAARAGRIGWHLEAQGLGGMHLMVDGVRIDPVVRGLSARFTLASGARDVWLVSSTGVAAEIAASPDRRRLGLCVRGLAFEDGFGAPRRVSLDDPCLCVGFHVVEDESGEPRRWTAGRACLPAALWEGLEGDLFVRLDLAGPALPRWVAPTTIPSGATVRLALVA